ncbi:aminopeptidase N-like [Leptopilina heterotoma]|uniref:aminopeptidase N-like n=1 Tax=Leptopilina heterotoma TaxID=63436 RepID=UPI001CA8FF17|nr:aminopeptidase N-like [Leptopilina heterotoma]XP_043485222.1 aminopeptidase N-like [Leptopilina heterotoma]
MRYIYFIVLLCIFIQFTQQLKNYRLPNVTIPLNYKLKFEPHLSPNNFTFHGEAEILIVLLSNTNNITLHSVDLTIFENETLLTGAENTFTPTEHIYEKESEFLILKFIGDLKPGIFKINFKFLGELRANFLGFFWDSYHDENGDTKYLAATQFEANYARMAFPCWDEPALKASFDISIKHFSNYTALSNMPIKTMISNTTDDKIWTVFKQTPLMSTYLVSFAVVDFSSITKTGGNITIWSRASNIDSMNLGLNVASQALTILEEFTDMRYQLPKMDILAVPNYPHGAMENWGLIVINEMCILNNKNSSAVQKLKLHQYMVHEYAHQWFGNLITPAWWNDIWITEGLSTYLDYFLSDKIYNFPRMMDLFAKHVVGVIGREDYFSNKLFRNVTSSTEALNLLRVVHEKAATIMHMLSNLMSKEAFQNGVRKILKKYKLETINTANFLQTMQESLDEGKIVNKYFKIEEVIMSYISQVGYPVIVMSRNYTTGTITLTQECTVCPRNKPQSKFFIPINFVTSSSLNFSSTLATHWLKPDDKELIIEGIHPDDWIIFNIKNTAYYRVIYDNENWERLKNYLHSDDFVRIHALNRAQLLENAFWLYKQRKVDKEFFLTFTLYMTREVDYVPWAVCDNILTYLNNNDFTLTMKNYILNLVKPLIEHLEVKPKENEDIFTSEKRYFAMYWNSKFDTKRRMNRNYERAKRDLIPEHHVFTSTVNYFD